MAEKIQFSRAEFNQSAPFVHMTTPYYALDYARLSWQDLWRLHPQPVLFFLSVLRRMLRVPLDAQPMVRPEALERLELNDVPSEAQLALTPSIQQLEACGLRVAFYYRILPQNPFKKRDLACGVAFSGSNPNYWARLGWVRVVRPRFVREKIAIKCHSRLADGRILTTGNRVPQLGRVSARESARWLADASPHKVVDDHLDRLRTLSTAGLDPVTESEFQTWILTELQDTFDSLTARGILVPVSVTPENALESESRSRP
ncbi:MAG: hypothetical protein ABSF50_14265 [Burkholderiaceae bacterium]